MSSRWIVWILLSVIAGCSRGVDPSKKAPEPEVPARIDVAPPAKVAEAPMLHALELAKIFDAASLPTSDETLFTELNAASIRAVVPGKLPDVASDFSKKLAERGWKEFDPVSKPAAPNDEYRSIHFVQNGHFVELVLSQEQKNKQPWTRVNLQFVGNFDTRTLPKPKNQPHLLATPPLSSFRTDRRPPDEAAAITKALVDDGWQEYVPFNSARLESRDNISRSFRKRGYLLNVFINLLPHQENVTNVTYAVRALAHELPAPPEATLVEFDDGQKKMRAEVPVGLEAVVGFYEKAMPEAGYTSLPAENPRPTSATLRYANPAKDVVVVSLLAMGEQTKINSYIVPATVFEKANSQAKSQPAAPKDAKGTTPDPTAKPVEKKTLLASQVPLPKDARNITYDAVRGEISFRSPAKIAAVVGQLRDRLAAAGWSEEKTIAIADATSGYLEFRQAQASLRITLINTGVSGATQVTMLTQGLTWSKENPE